MQQAATKGDRLPKAHGSFEITSMNEDPYEELDGGGKLTRAWGEHLFSGDIEGDLEGLRGEGEFRAPSGPKASYELDYDFD